MKIRGKYCEHHYFNEKYKTVLYNQKYYYITLNNITVSTILQYHLLSERFYKLSTK